MKRWIIPAAAVLVLGSSFAFEGRNAQLKATEQAVALEQSLKMGLQSDYTCPFAEKRSPTHDQY